MNGQFLPRKNPAKTVKGRGFLDRGLMNTRLYSMNVGNQYLSIYARMVNVLSRRRGITSLE